MSIVGLGSAEPARQHAFIRAVQRALIRYPDLAAVLAETPRASRQEQALEPLLGHSQALVNGLAGLDAVTRRALRRRGIDVNRLNESILALEVAVEALLKELQQEESRGATKASARKQVLVWLTDVFTRYYPNPPAWHRRKTLVQFLRRACAVIRMPLPQTDHQLIALLPTALRPAPSK